MAEGLEPRLAAGFREKGFVVLSWADGGWVQFFAKSPVATPQDLAAQKLFSWSGDQATTELWKAAGFQPVPLPATEISTALQTGLVTAVATSAQAAVLLQWYEHAPYLTDLPWAVLVGGIVVSERSWEKVPAELRGPLAEAARETGRKLSAQTRESAPEHVAAMVRRGLTVVPVDAAGRAEWERRVVEAYPKLRDGFVPADAFTAAPALRDAWRARDGNGEAGGPAGQPVRRLGASLRERLLVAAFLLAIALPVVEAAGRPSAASTSPARRYTSSSSRSGSPSSAASSRPATAAT